VVVVRIDDAKQLANPDQEKHTPCLRFRKKITEIHTHYRFFHGCVCFSFKITIGLFRMMSDFAWALLKIVS
jgi:hypothetical protein